jgi:hypothetical protein
MLPPKYLLRQTILYFVEKVWYSLGKKKMNATVQLQDDDDDDTEQGEDDKVILIGDEEEDDLVDDCLCFHCDQYESSCNGG